MRPDVLRDFLLDPAWAFLNHGSFGAAPRPVLAAQRALVDEIERQPVTGFMRTLEPQLDAARRRLAGFIGAAPADLVFVRNATQAVNAVLRSLPLAAGDELLTTNQAYAACKNALDYVAERAGARVVVVDLPFPVHDDDRLIQPILDAATDRTRLCLLDHISSPTGMILPVEQLIRPLEERGVRVLLDGAHAPGQLDLDLDDLGASYATGNAHKWLFAPKGSAYLHVRADRHREVRPTSISHAVSLSLLPAPPEARGRLHLEFDWTGTDDFTPWFALPVALDFGARLVDGGWPALRAQNRALALAGRAVVADALEIELPCADARVGHLAALPLPDGDGRWPDPLYQQLVDEKIEVPIQAWPARPQRVLRVSAQVYNELDDYRRLADALRRALR